MQRAILFCMVWGVSLAQSHLPAHVGPGRQAAHLTGVAAAPLGPPRAPAVTPAGRPAPQVEQGSTVAAHLVSTPLGPQHISSPLLNSLVQQLDEPRRERTLTLLARYKELYERSLRAQQAQRAQQDQRALSVQPAQKTQVPQQSPTVSSPRRQLPLHQLATLPLDAPLGAQLPSVSPAQPGIPSGSGAGEDPALSESPGLVGGSETGQDSDDDEESEEPNDVKQEAVRMQTSEAHDGRSAEDLANRDTLSIFRKISGKGTEGGMLEQTLLHESEPMVEPQSPAYQQSRQFLQLLAKIKPIARSPTPEPRSNSQNILPVSSHNNAQQQHATRTHPFPWTIPAPTVKSSPPAQPTTPAQPVRHAQPFPVQISPAQAPKLVSQFRIASGAPSFLQAHNIPQLQLAQNRPKPPPTQKSPQPPLKQTPPQIPLAQRLPQLPLSQKVSGGSSGQPALPFPWTQGTSPLPLPQKIPAVPQSRPLTPNPHTQVKQDPATSSPSSLESLQPSDDPVDSEASGDDDTPFPWDSFRAYLRGSSVNLPSVTRKHTNIGHVAEPKSNTVATSTASPQEFSVKPNKVLVAKPKNWWHLYFLLERPQSELEPRPAPLEKWWLKYKDPAPNAGATEEEDNSLGLWESINRHEQEKREEEEKAQRRRERWGKVKEVLSSIFKRFRN